MSSKKYATPLRLEITPSRFLFILLVVLHVAGMFLIYMLAFNTLVILAGAFLILWSAYFVVNKYALLRSTNTIIKLVWGGDSEWILEQNNGNKIIAKLQPDSYVHASITILIFKDISKKHFNLFPISVVLLKDNVAPNDFRRLRVRLKIDKPIDDEFP